MDADEFLRRVDELMPDIEASSEYCWNVTGVRKRDENSKNLAMYECLRLGQKTLPRARRLLAHRYGQTRIVAELDRRIEQLPTKPNADDTTAVIQWLKGELLGLVEDIRTGLDEPTGQHSQVHAGLLGVARRLCDSGETMASAMVAGAVLENHLRALCAARSIEVKSRGRHSTIADYNEALRVEDDYPQARWRQVQAWTDLRNAAAHHDTDNFVGEQVPAMIDGIDEFIHSLAA